MKSSWVITQTTLAGFGDFFYMQISTAIIEKSILFNTVGMHDNVQKIMSMLTFS